MKKVISLILSLMMLTSVVSGIQITALAAGNDLASATYYSLTSTASGTISSSNQRDVYYFNLPSSGLINLSFTGYMQNIELQIYDVEGKELYCKYDYWNSNTKQIKVNEGIELVQGKYYIAIVKDDYYGSYNFNINFTSANESFGESINAKNNSLVTASPIALNTQYIGQIAKNDDVDNYVFTTSTSGTVDFSFVGYLENIQIKMYDVDGKEMYSKYAYWNSNTKQISVNEKVDLTQGTYYLSVAKDDYYGNYVFSLPFTAANESYPESGNGSNNSIATASPISIGASYIGHLAKNDTVDTFYFSVSSSSPLYVYLESSMGNINAAIYNTNGSKEWSKWAYRNNVTNKTVISEAVTLSPGTYYLSVSKDDYYGAFAFCLSYPAPAPAQSNSSSSGSTGTTTTVKKPGKVTIKKANGSKRQFSVSWKKVSGAKGYQVQYSTDSTFKKGKKTVTITKGSTTSKTVKKLQPKKKYYVRVRAYKMSNGSKVYGKWSESKAVRIK